MSASVGAHGQRDTISELIPTAGSEHKSSFAFSTASKIAFRELRASPAKFLFVILAVAVGVAALSGVKGFGYAFKGMLLRNAKQLIAADVQAQMFSEPSADQTNRIEKMAGQYGWLTRVTETMSMAGSEKQADRAHAAGRHQRIRCNKRDCQCHR